MNPSRDVQFGVDRVGLGLGTQCFGIQLVFRTGFEAGQLLLLGKICRVALYVDLKHSHRRL